MKWSEIEARVRLLSHHDLATTLLQVLNELYREGDNCDLDKEHDSDTLSGIACVVADLVEGGAE